MIQEENLYIPQWEFEQFAPSLLNDPATLEMLKSIEPSAVWSHTAELEIIHKNLYNYEPL